MGVDFSASIGTGIHIPESFLDALDTEEEGSYEVLERLLGSDFEHLTFLTGGSYYDSEPIDFVVVGKSSVISIEDDQGGVKRVDSINTTLLTVDERRDLMAFGIAANLPDELNFVSTYVTTLWH